MTAGQHEDLSTQHWPVEIRLKQAEKALEVDFFKGALQKVEARRRSGKSSGETASTSRSGK